MGTGRRAISVLATLRWRPRLAALNAALDACDSAELPALAMGLVVMLREVGAAGTRGREVRDEVMSSLIRRWRSLPTAVRTAAIGAAAGEDGWTGLCVRLAAESDEHDSETKLAAVACAAECGEPEAAMLLATLVGDDDRRAAAAAEMGLLALVERAHEDGSLLRDAGAHATISRAAARAVEACVDRPREDARGNDRSDDKGVLKALAVLVGTPALQVNTHERVRALLDDAEHPLHRRLNGLVRRDVDPGWRALAWSWLGGSRDGGSVASARACVDRLGSVPPAVSPTPPAAMGEQAGVAERSHLVLNPVREGRVAEAFAQSKPQRGERGLFGAWLPSIDGWGELTERQRLGTLGLAERLLTGVDEARAQQLAEPAWYAALADPSPHVRHRLVRWLADSAAPMTLDLLADAAFDADRRVAVSAMRALCRPVGGAGRDRRGVERLAGVCAVVQRSPHATLRRMGARRAAALETWNTASAEARLMARRLGRLDPEGSRAAVLEVMEQWADRPIEAVAAASAARRAGVDVQGEFFELVTLLAELPGDVRRREHDAALADAARLLARSAGPRGEELLVACAADSDARVRANAVESLGAACRAAPTPAPRLVELLGVRVEDSEHRVRSSAAAALCRQRHDACVERGARALGAMLADERSPHRVAGLWALGAVAAELAASKERVPMLVWLGAEAARLAKDDPHEAVRWRAGRVAAMVLTLLRTPSAMPRREQSVTRDGPTAGMRDRERAEVAS